MVDLQSLGLVHVYTGNGKGKTSAALGLALRALGHGLRVCMVQFLKGGSYTGELHTQDKFEAFTIKQFGKGSEDEPHFKDFSADEQDRQRALKALEYAASVVKKVDVLILDEINVALQLNNLNTKEVVDFIKQKPEHLELVLTGRNAPSELTDVADYVTEMKAHKHPYNKGILGREGIDY